LHTVAYLDQVVRPNIEKAATGAGRSAAQVEMVATVFVITGRDENEIEQAKGPVRQQIAFYGSTPSYRPVLEASGWDIGDRLHAMSRRGEWAEMADVITDDILEEVGVQAPVDRLAQAIKDRYGDRVDRVGFYTLGSVLDTDKDALRQVIAELKR
jgi:alkanesulfonate monooxygenase SsuD/methylene tetrahydromethanopterin reductase-like flavin-dependent oxidoreductase (luciferase family)